MRRKRSAVFGAVCTLFALILAACGGGGGGASGGGNSGIGNTMTVSLDEAAPTTYTEGAINGNGYYDPDMEADVYTDSGRTILMLSSGVSGGATPPVTLINIVTSDHVTGAYPITGDGTYSGPTPTTTYVYYKDNAKDYDSIISSGTVTLDSIGDVGAPVIGSFSAVILCTSSTQTHWISGTFNMKRAH